MPKYLCSEGHIHKSQEAATNCHWCKKRKIKNREEMNTVMHFLKIRKDIDERMNKYDHSMHPTKDEVTIAWLVAELGKYIK